jgi:hypothetical protein
MSLSSKAYILCVCRKDLGRDDALVSRVILDKWWGGLGLATSVIKLVLESFSAAFPRKED